MPDFPRYAIYYVPSPDNVLYRFGAAMLGYDPYSGASLPLPTDVPPNWHELTHDPRKYGFHATLKAPMALLPGKSEVELVAACESFAATPRVIPSIVPVVDVISGFIAIIPSVASTALAQLSANCVREFDSFRKPLTAEDRARRNPTLLTSRQRDYLENWGYPYVFEEFRFHMTLTGRIDDATTRERVTAMLRERFRSLHIERLRIDRLALFHQPGSQERFRLIGHWPLRG